MAGHTKVTAHMRSDVRPELVRSVLRLHREVTRLRGRAGDEDYRASLRDLSARRLERKRDGLRAQLRSLKASSTPVASAGPGAGTANGTLAAIAACESGGNPAAVDPSGTYRGKYQFTRETWAATGGSGDPAAAPEAEQDRRAAALYASAGAGQWPVCGR
jgi:hypothetical protein